jgi:hypothetical protein
MDTFTDLMQRILRLFLLNGNTIHPQALASNLVPAAPIASLIVLCFACHPHQAKHASPFGT